MGKPLGDEHSALILGCQFDPKPLPKCGRTVSKVKDEVVRGTSSAADKFSLPVRMGLEM